MQTQDIKSDKDLIEDHKVSYCFGTKCVGEFIHGAIHGRAEITFSDGIKYIGKLKAGVPNTKGVLIYPDGSRYEGGFKNGVFHGKGKQTFVIQNDDFDQDRGSNLDSYLIYDGKFENGLRHGKAKLIWSNGDVEV